MSILNKYPRFSSRSTLRKEASGGVFISETGSYHMVTETEYAVLRGLNSETTILNSIKRITHNEVQFAQHLLALLSMCNAGITTVNENSSQNLEWIKLSEHKWFSPDAFSTPIQVSLGVTTKCNRACRHCYRLIYKHKTPMENNQLLKCIDEVAKLNIAELNITGGEPLLNTDIIGVLKHATENINAVALSTNGTLLDMRFIEEAKSLGVKRIQIGLNAIFDSPGKELAKQDLDRLSNFLTSYNCDSPEIILGAVVTKNVVRNLRTLIELAALTKKRFLRLGPLFHCHQGCSNCTVSNEGFVVAVQNAFALGRKIGVTIVFSDGLTDPSVAVAPEGRKRFCYLGTGILHIEADGSIYPCSALLSPSFCIGKLTDSLNYKRLLSLWKKSPILNMIRSVTVDSIHSCSSCSIKAACAGGCRTAAFWSTGSIAGENPYCEVNRALWEEDATHIS